MSRAVSDRLAELHGRIARAAERAGREPASIRLIAVTKGVDAALARAALEAGQLDLGESRVQELVRKAGELADQPAGGAPAPAWHLIGHLQGNKARRAVELAAAIHSVDSPRLLDALERLAGELGRRPRVYLEVKSVASAERTGVEPAALGELVEHARRARHLELAGLMTIAPAPEPALDAGQNAARARTSFRALAELARALPSAAFAGGRPELSMGMSSDFEEAILEGADWLRVGGAIFGGLAP